VRMTLLFVRQNITLKLAGDPKMKKTILISLSAMLLFATNVISAAPTDIETFRNTATILRTMWHEGFSGRVHPLPILPETQIAENIEILKLLPKIGDNGAVNFLLSQYNAISSHSAGELLLIYRETATVSNLCLQPNLLRRKLGNTDFWHYRDSDYIDIVFPLSSYSVFDVSALITGNFPEPRPERDGVIPLALTFSRLGLYGLAWRVQMEEGIRRYDTSPLPSRSFHLRAADNAYRAGNKELAWSFLINATVFDHESFFEPAMETAQLWFDIEAGTAELPEVEIVRGEERKKLFLEIVERYQKMNAHPRAWFFIQEHKHEFDDPSGLIRTVQNNWRELVNRAVSHPSVRKVVYYGVQFYPRGGLFGGFFSRGPDPLSVEIPWAFPEGSLEKMKERLSELATRAGAGFRFWMYDDTGNDRWESVRARFIASIDDYVILEAEDGKKKAVKFSQLLGDDHEFSKIRGSDQDYVRQRIKDGTMTPEEEEHFRQLLRKITQPARQGSVFVPISATLATLAVLVGGGYAIWHFLK